MGIILSANTTQFIGDLISPSGTTFPSGSTELLSPVGEFTIEDIRASVDLQSKIDSGDIRLFSNTDELLTTSTAGINYITTYGGIINQPLLIDGGVSATTFYGSASGLTGFSTSSLSYFDAYDLSGGTITSTGTWGVATVPLNTQRQNDSDYTHSVSVDNDEITINTTDRFLINGRVTTNASSSSSRTGAECRLEVDTGSGFVEVQGTTAEMYLRQTNYGATGSFSAVLDLNIGDKLRISFRRSVGGANIILMANGSSLNITKVRGEKGQKGETGDLNLNTFTDFYVSGTTFSNVFSGNTQEAVFYGDGSNLTGLVDAEISYMIWAEESGSLINNNRQWSFGNGATGVDNVYIMYDSTVTKMFIAAEAVGTTATIDLMINDVAVATGSFAGNGIYTFPVPIDVFEGDELGFQTNTVVGSWTDVRTGVAVLNDLTGLRGEKGETGDISGATNATVSGTVFSDTYSGLTTEATYYGDGSNLTGINNYYVSGGTYNGGSQNIDFTGNDVITTFSVDVSALLDDTNNYVSGGTVSGTDLLLHRNGGLSDVTIDTSAYFDNTNTFVTGFTYDSANNLNIGLNDGSTLSTTINEMSGLTIDGTLSATTYLNLPKATTAEINTGGETDNLINPDQLEDSKYTTQSGAKISTTASGTDTYTAIITPAITGYTSTQRFYVKFTNANTGAATLNLNGLGAKNLYKGVSTPLIGGDILAGKILEVVYDGTNFQMVSEVGTPGVITGALIFGGLITPPELTADVDDWNPSGLSETSFIRVSTSGVQDITGIQAPSPPVAQAIYLVNIGGSNLRLKENDGDSLAVNRILSNGNVLLAGDESVLLVYDTTSLRWRVASLYN